MHAIKKIEEIDELTPLLSIKQIDFINKGNPPNK